MTARAFSTLYRERLLRTVLTRNSVVLALPGIVPRPQRYGKWLCGGAALKRPVIWAALRAVRRCRVGFPRLPDPNWEASKEVRRIARLLATRAGASWSDPNCSCNPGIFPDVA